MNGRPVLLGATLAVALGAPVMMASQVVWAQSQAVSHDPGVRPVPEIDHIYRQFSLAYRELDAKAVAALYTRDALYLQPGREIQQGRVPIEATFGRFFLHSRSVGLRLDISFRIVAREVAGGLAYDVGVFTLVTSREGEEVGRSFGKFVNVSRPDADGAWRFQVGSHSDLDAPGG